MLGRKRNSESIPTNSGLALSTHVPQFTSTFNLLLKPLLLMQTFLEGAREVGEGGCMNIGL